MLTEDNIGGMAALIWLIWQIHCRCKGPTAFASEIDKLVLKFTWKCKETRRARTISKKEVWEFTTATFQLQNFLQSYRNPDSVALAWGHSQIDQQVLPGQTWLLVVFCFSVFGPQGHALPVVQDIPNYETNDHTRPRQAALSSAWQTQNQIHTWGMHPQPKP